MWLLIGLILVLVVLIYRHLNGSFEYWKKRGVPSPPTKPWVGNIGDSIIMKRSLGEIYTDIYKKYKDYLYVGVYRMQSPVILIRDSELIKTVLIKDFNSFHDNDIEIDEKVDPIFGKNPFVLKGHKWKVMRSYITTGISAGKVKNMFPLMANVGKSLTNYLNIEPETKGKDGLDAKELATKYTTDAVASSAFGLEANSFVDPNSEFRKMGQRLFNKDFFTSIKFLFLNLMPKLALIFKATFIPEEVRDWFIGILRETIKYREENNIVRNDYLDLMIALKTKDLEYEFNDIDVMAQAMTFYADGFETSSVSLSFALYEIAINLDVQSKLQKEVDTILAKHKGEITYEAVQEMSYLDRVITETMRKHPPALHLRKKCTQTYTFPPPNKDGTGKELVVEKGTSIIIPVYAIHTDPNYYPNPEKFDPERFTEEAKNSRPKCTYLPFGEGPRMCLGYRFGLTQIKAAVVSVIVNFNIKLNPKTTPTFEIDPSYFLLSKKGGIWLNFSKRNK